MRDLQTILTWLNQLGWPTTDIAALPGDVSLRRYLRANLGNESLIVAAYPLQMRSSCQRYLETTELLTAVGVRVPRVLAHDCAQGLMALEDVGSQTLYDLQDLDEVATAAFFHHAIDTLESIQTLPRERLAALNPPLDADLLRQELEKTWDALLTPRGVAGSDSFGRALRACFEEICTHLGADILVPCHRDYMVRNLIPLQPHPTLVVIDHQDLRLGPRYYDLASMLNDSLFPSQELEEEILNTHLAAGPEARLRYHRAAAQRTLKAVGTYETFAQRGFERHRKLIRPTFDRALRHLEQLPEADEIVAELAQRLRAQGIC